MKRRCNELGGGGVDTMEEEKMMKRCRGWGGGRYKGRDDEKEV